MNESELAWIVFRAAYSFVFLNAAWQCGKNRSGIEWTIAESRILFGDGAKLLGPGGIVVMAGGGLSILLGLFAELGGTALALFLVMGTVIHLRQRDRASALAKAVAHRLGDAQLEALQQLAVSAQLGHYSSAMKNLSLAGPAFFFAIMGSGPWSLARLWGLAG